MNDTALTMEKMAEMIDALPDMPRAPYGLIVAPADLALVWRELQVEERTGQLITRAPAVGVCVHQERGTVKVCDTFSSWKAQLVACGCWWGPDD